MKKTPILFVLLAVFSSLCAQETEISMSNVERFCKTPGKCITGQLIFQDNHVFLKPSIDVLVMKYMDNISKDAVIGVTFSSLIWISTDMSKTYRAMVDCEEIGNIISWLEANQWILNSVDPKLGYVSYAPKQGKLLFKLRRHSKGNGTAYESKFWDFVLQYDKFDADSEMHFNIRNIKTIIDRLKEIQKVVGV